MKGDFSCDADWNEQASIGRLSRMVLAVLLALGRVFVPAGPSGLAAQAGPCDPALTQPAGDPLGYRLRGDRCEGLYVRGVSSPALRVVSLTASVEDFDPATRRPLRVEWTAPPGAAVRLRGEALRRKVYYRFDAIRPADSASYRWDPLLLASLGLKKLDLGLLAWGTLPVGDTRREVHFPVRVAQQAAAAPSRPYELVLLPGVELKEVYLTLARLGPDGRPGAFLRKDQPLGLGFYPAERAIVVPLEAPDASGIYYLEIGAELRAGGSSATRIWLYQPPA